MLCKVGLNGGNALFWVGWGRGGLHVSSLIYLYIVNVEMFSMHAHVDTLAITLLLHHSLENIEMFVLGQALLRSIPWSSCNANTNGFICYPNVFIYDSAYVYTRACVAVCMCTYHTQYNT